ncbi:unnamed protein product [Owenia fusiformis]|uniref:G-protein coupled receptors family 1 profile domain-containing protein n=1 Tax=Owenia fusiformis TaxID=6347 RepID=A0A8S4N288_OWEFU|nr:unnamed protein product [Owenia fusiformis]
MLVYINALCWAGVTGAAILGVILILKSVTYYRSSHQTHDILMLSLLCTMLLNAVIILPIHLVMLLNNFQWHIMLCQFFVWCTITFRMAGLLSITALGFDRVLSLRLPSRYRYYGNTCSGATFIFLLWIIASFIGIALILGWSDINFHSTSQCQFLSHAINRAFAIFVPIVILTSFIVTTVTLSDACSANEYLRKNMLIMKYRKNRSSSKIPPSIRLENHAESWKKPILLGSDEFNTCYVNCKATLVVAMLSFILNHLPYMVLSFMGILSYQDHSHLEIAAMWCILIEVLVVPHVLWIVNPRIRHALAQTLRCHCCGPPSPDSSNMGVTFHGYSPRHTTDTNELVESTEINTKPKPANGATPTADIELSVRPNGSANGIRHPDAEKQAGTDSDHESENAVGGLGNTVVTASVHKHPNANSPAKKENSGLSSRQQWKENLQKNHVKTGFINEAFDDDIEKIKQNNHKQDGASPKKGHTKNESLTYVSSDFHHDAITQNRRLSVPTPKGTLEKQKNTDKENECETPPRKYSIGDVNIVLDMPLKETIVDIAYEDSLEKVASPEDCQINVTSDDINDESLGATGGASLHVRPLTPNNPFNEDACVNVDVDTNTKLFNDQEDGNNMSVIRDDEAFENNLLRKLQAEDISDNDPKWNILRKESKTKSDSVEKGHPLWIELDLHRDIKPEVPTTEENQVFWVDVKPRMKPTRQSSLPGKYDVVKEKRDKHPKRRHSDLSRNKRPSIIDAFGSNDYNPELSTIPGSSMNLYESSGSLNHLGSSWTHMYRKQQKIPYDALNDSYTSNNAFLLASHREVSNNDLITDKSERLPSSLDHPDSTNKITSKDSDSTTSVNNIDAFDESYNSNGELEQIWNNAPLDRTDETPAARGVNNDCISQTNGDREICDNTINEINEIEMPVEHITIKSSTATRNIDTDTESEGTQNFHEMTTVL